MLPHTALECIVRNLDCRDRARFECVSKEIRDVCRSIPVQDASTTVTPTRAHLASFALFVCRNRKSLRTLGIATDVNAWSWIWRFIGPCYAFRMREMALIHTSSEQLTLKSPEDVFPVTDMLDTVMIMSPSTTYLGEGFCRVRTASLTVSAPILESEPNTWIIPRLRSLIINSLRCNPFAMINGLAMTNLRHLEVHAIFLQTAVPLLPRLETLVLTGSIKYVAEGFEIRCPLRCLRILSAHWRDISWAPQTLETLEIVHCSKVPDVAKFVNLKKVVIMSTPVTLECNIHLRDLTYFGFFSFGVRFHPFAVFAHKTNIDPEDAPHIKLYAPRR
jgi:hypothetical protein